MRFQSYREYSKVVQLELNEISLDVIQALCEQGELPNFSRVLDSWHTLRTSSESEYHLIEPWIQWVTAHTGKTFAEHKVYHLGNQSELQHDQVWEVLSDSETSSAIIGSMNALRGRTEGGVFFPDPWAKKDETYPRALSPLWRLFSTKVQQHATQPLRARDLVNGAICTVKLGLPVITYLRVLATLTSAKLNKNKKWKLASLFDYLLAEIFLAISRSHANARYFTLFLNSVAHFQHHYWRNFERSHFNAKVFSPDCGPDDNPVLDGYKNFDRILGKVLDRFDNEDVLFIILSGLSQEPFLDHEELGGMNYYRLRDHRAFVANLCLTGAKVLPLMSRDWRIEFESESSLLAGEETLKGITVEGKDLFKVEREADRSIFIETKVTQSLPEDCSVNLADGTPLGLFADLFANIAIKSGHHTGTGVLLLSDPELLAGQQSVPLTAMYELTLSALGINTSASQKLTKANEAHVG